MGYVGHKFHRSSGGRLTLSHRVRVDRSTWESDASPVSANEVLPETDITRNVQFVANPT